MAEGEAKVIDARGSYCPGPLMELIRAIQTEPVGTVLEVLSSDRASSNDIPEWVKKVGQEYLETVAEDGYWRVRVRRVK
ncbi:MAG: sulfurtransferase TusA family protein [Thermaerobacter sp.]|nr:sulfurtransferase TusA family protein [Thermaerobacter sp.]